MQQEFGCNARQIDENTWEAPALNPLQIDGEDVYACPRRPIKDNPLFWSRLMALYRGFTQGFLPDDGNISAQSARGWSLLTILDGYVNEAKNELFENAKKR